MSPNHHLSSWAGCLFVVIHIAVLNQHWVHANRFCSNDPSPPRCANDCSGNGYYLSHDETRCIQCPTCEPGKELDKICGDGLNEDAQCVPCQEGFFSADEARRCIPCRACTNTVELKACERSSDRECGECLPGYLRSGDRFGDPDACPLRCRDQSPDTPGCREWWKEQNGDDGGGMDGDGDVPLKEETVQDYDFECESTPPQCEDDCHGNRLYLGRDGLCKLCLQCQPGYALDKNCGNGRNGDAECIRCEEGYFSVDGRGQCIPCRECDNTEEVTGCESTHDRECGGCLPGYFQAADEFFDPDACPNSCAHNPRDTPECIDWWQQQDAIATDVGRPLIHTEPQEVQQPLQTEEDLVVFQKDESDGKDPQIAKESSTTLHHSSHMTVITALASLLVIVVIIVVLAFIILRVYTKKPRPKIITDVGGPLLSESGRSTPVATPDLTGPHSSSRIFKQPSNLPSATSLSNERPFWDKIHQNHVQGTLPYRIDGQLKNFGRDQPSFGQDEPDTTQSTQHNNRRIGRFQGPPLDLKSSAAAPPDKENAVLYTSDPNGATRSVLEKSEAGTTLRRRSSIVSPMSPDGLQVLRRNSLQLNNLASNGSHAANGRGQRKRSTGGPNEFPDRMEKEKEAALFPGDSPTETGYQEADAIYKFNQSGPEDIERGLNSQGKPVSRDVDLNKSVSNAGKTIPNMPPQIEEGRSEKEPALDNPRNRPTAGQKQRNQHPMNTSITLTSESPVVNINFNTQMVRTVHVGDTYNEHHDGTQDALLSSDDGRRDGMEDQSEAEEDTSLMNT